MTKEEQDLNFKLISQYVDLKNKLLQDPYERDWFIVQFRKSYPEYLDYMEQERERERESNKHTTPEPVRRKSKPGTNFKILYLNE